MELKNILKACDEALASKDMLIQYYKNKCEELEEKVGDLTFKYEGYKKEG